MASREFAFSAWINDKCRKTSSIFTTGAYKPLRVMKQWVS